MKDDLSKVAEAVHLGRRTLRVIQFNIAFSISVKLIFLVLAIFGYTSLWLAIAADTGATLIVTANALRLLRVEPELSSIRKQPKDETDESIAANRLDA
jgi:Cd2+/Zn2+-exporting ATPase